MKMIKLQKGISIIALIITVILLLILAGVTIKTMSEKSGIIKRAEETTLKSDYQMVKTGLELYKAENEIEGKRKNNEDLIGMLAKKVVVKDTSRELAVLVDFDIINSAPNYGKGGMKLLEEDNNDKEIVKKIETVYDIKDVYVIDLEDGVFYYIDGENIYTLETERIEIEENGIIVKKYPIETINGQKHVNEESFITKWNVTLGETEGSETYSTVVLPVYKNSSYDAIIHWGDGTSTVLQHKTKVDGVTLTLTDAELIDKATHTYTLGENGDEERIIEIEGTYTDFRMDTSSSTPTKLKLTQIEQWGNIGLTSVNFKDCTNLGGVVPKTNREDSFEKCSSFQYCFYKTGIQSLEEGFALPNNIGGQWSIYQMFYNCSNLVSIPNSFKIPPKVTSTSGLFCGCSRLESLPESFNIHSGVANMGSMFHKCTSLKKLPTNFYIPSVCTNVANIVSYCSSLEELPSGFILPANYSGTLQYFFRGCDSLKTLPDGFTIPKGVTNVKYMCMYSGIESLPDSFSIPESYTGSINHMFHDANLQKIPDNFKIPAGVTNISCLFRSNEKLKGSITILGNPETYDTCFSNTAIESGGTLTVNYSKNCTNIDAIIATGGNKGYVVKGEQID